MLPSALGGLRVRVPPVPGRHTPGSNGKDQVVTRSPARHRNYTTPPLQMASAGFWLEVPQFSQALPPLPDTPRGISETPMVRVPAAASLLRTFQPHPGDALCCDYSGLRPIYATQSHPKMLTLAHIQSLSGAKLRSGNAPAPKASGWPRAKPEPRSGRKGTRESPNARRQAMVLTRGNFRLFHRCIPWMFIT